MLVESFRSLKSFGSVEHYRYIGLGSVYFSDFSLVHRSLGVEEMISIENATDSTVQSRFRLNVPYGNVRMMFGTSTAVLQKLSWDQPTICWLDYDGALVKSCLDDVEYFSRNASSGSVIVLSFNAGNIGGGEGVKPLEALQAAVGKDNVPADVESRGLSGWGVGDIYRRIVFEAIKSALKARSAKGGAWSEFEFKPIYYFRYADGVKMITIGGVLVSASHAGNYQACNFEQFDFCRFDDSAYLIDPPLLTYAEMRQIDVDRTKVACGLPLPTSDIEKYSQFYRYFPRFVEAEIS
nr:O-methyltransferase [Stenotrophomonas pictorum]